jgi:transketolase
MRDVLSDLIVTAAREDDRFLVLSGDHGYALFDAIRAERSNQFVNVGVAEQNMIGVAAGLAKVGFRPCVYGLAAFVPIRVLEQIKLDLCHSRLPVMMLGDGAGLVYSTLGVSHQCGEDIACLRPLPHVAIYSPCDAHELVACWREARTADHPTYIRLGKADRPPVHASPLANTEPVFTHRPGPEAGGAVIVATGSMVSPCTEFARRQGVACISVPRIKPFPDELLGMCRSASRVIVVEEHAGTGGLWTSVVEQAARRKDAAAGSMAVESLALESAFTKTGGSWQQSLREHCMADDQLLARLQQLLEPSVDRDG